MAHVRIPPASPVRPLGAGSLLAALVLVAGLGVLSPALAAAERYAAIVIDANTGRTLFARNADEPRYPASLTKMMTLFILFEEISTKRMSLATPFRVSAYAARQAPSKLGLKPGETITAGEAIRALVTKSANDAAVVVGENISGSEEAFARRMTQTARSLGMRNTTFRNASGLPDLQQKTTARDMAILGIALRQRYPTLYRFFSTTTFQFRGQNIRGHNRLLGRVEGVDGIKTGYIRLSGFNLVTSVNRDGRLLVATVMGGDTARARDAHMAQLIETYLPQAAARRGGAPAAIAIENGPRRGEIPPTPSRPSAVATLPAAKGPPTGLLPEEYGDTSDDEDMEGAGAVSSITTAPSVPKSVAAPQPSRATAQKATGTKVAAIDGAEVVPPAAKTAKGSSKTAAAPAKAPAAPQEEAATAPAGKGAWVIQIGAVPSVKAANDLLARARGAADRALKGAEAYTQKVEGNASLYRARFGGFASQSTANAACAALSAKQFPCLAMRR